MLDIFTDTKLSPIKNDVRTKPTITCIQILIELYSTTFTKTKK
ncbi:Hypothetical protein MCYN_0144 [Mycoplasmopsis cynos C142]|uniref:Uncharacterized protein n=1 Tax=Mycoplasmopsis cynos (strain C142) TaxID=1246955 RepID=L0RW70_MYCC1|nr:Hypothetical protein MCYN_0144 [Mycoplasmopsis cynos C142]